jgi:hypothetical protein
LEIEGTSRTKRGKEVSETTSWKKRIAEKKFPHLVLDNITPLSRIGSETSPFVRREGYVRPL